MDLILWRHAEAFEMREVENDLDRALTPKGERQAQRMAEWLNQRLAHSTRTLAELAPDGNGEALLKAARWPDASEPVLVIGHQPTLGFVASYLLSEQPQAWTIKKGAVWWIRSRNREDTEQVILQAVQSPDCL